MSKLHREICHAITRMNRHSNVSNYTSAGVPTDALNAACTRRIEIKFIQIAGNCVSVVENAIKLYLSLFTIKPAN